VVIRFFWAILHKKRNDRETKYGELAQYRKRDARLEAFMNDEWEMPQRGSTSAGWQNGQLSGKSSQLLHVQYLMISRHGYFPAILDMDLAGSLKSSMAGTAALMDSVPGKRYITWTRWGRGAAHVYQGRRAFAIC
jgi:hypothetical protein